MGWRSQGFPALNGRMGWLAGTLAVVALEMVADPPIDLAARNRIPSKLRGSLCLQNPGLVVNSH